MNDTPYMAKGAVPGYGTILMLKDKAEQADRLERENEALRGERDHLRNMVEIVLYHHPITRIFEPDMYKAAYNDLKKQIEKEYYKAPWIEVPGKEDTNA